MKKIHVDMLMTVEEKAQAVSDAHRHEMNLSQYIRWLIGKERREAKAKADATALAELKTAMGFKEGQK